MVFHLLGNRLSFVSLFLVLRQPIDLAQVVIGCYFDGYSGVKCIFGSMMDRLLLMGARLFYAIFLSMLWPDGFMIICGSGIIMIAYIS